MYVQRKMRICQFTLGISLGLLVISSSLSSQTFDPANSQSIAVLKTKAASGDSKAQFDLGHAYESGIGIPQDYEQAATWYRKAADQGMAEAQVMIGAMYALGEGGLQQDLSEAAQWTRKAAVQGNSEAQMSLGQMYQEGLGVAKDDKQAAAWIRQAADQGNAAAQLEVGVLYEKHQGVPQNYAEAAVWFRKAAEQGSADAQFNLGLLYAGSQGGVPNNTTLAAEWMRKSAEQNNGEAQSYLGFLYLMGEGVPQEYSEAYFWLHLATSKVISSPKLSAVITQEKSEAAAHLTKANLLQTQERARKWLEDFDANTHEGPSSNNRSTMATFDINDKRLPSPTSKPLVHQASQIQPFATVYIEPMDGYETYLAAAIAKKQVPVIVVADKDKAAYLIRSTINHSTSPQPAVVINNTNGNSDGNSAFENGAQRAAERRAARGATGSSISVIDASSTQIVFAYSVGKSGGGNQAQSAAEACAKHLKEFIEKTKN